MERLDDEDRCLRGNLGPIRVLTRPSTVNTASRMESHGVTGCIQVTERTYQRLRNG